MNTILLFSELIISFASIIYLYKNYKKEGLYIWAIIATIIGNIMVTKTISISNLDINLGVITLSTLFVIINIIIQKYGDQETNTLLFTILITSIISYLIYSLISITTISNITPTMDKSFNNIILNNIILYIVNTISLIISLKLNSYIYYRIKVLENKLWISNLISMIISQLIYGIMFGTMYLAYQNTFFDQIIIVIIRFLLAILTQFVGTIVIYYFNTKNV